MSLEAGAFLEGLLAHGPMAAKEVEGRAAARGISPATLERAKEALGIRAKRKRFGADGHWEWSLSEEHEALRKGAR